MESGKWLGKIYAPVNAELIEINEELELDPTLINEDSYGEGWMYKIKPDNMDDINNLIHGSEALEKWMAEEIEKYKDQQE